MGQKVVHELSGKGKGINRFVIAYNLDVAEKTVANHPTIEFGYEGQQHEATAPQRIDELPSVS